WATSRRDDRARQPSVHAGPGTTRGGGRERRDARTPRAPWRDLLDGCGCLSARRCEVGAVVEHDREQHAHALHAIDLAAGERLLAIVLGEGDEEIGAGAVAREDEVRREIERGGDRRSADRDLEIVVHVIVAEFSAQIVLEAAYRLGV